MNKTLESAIAAVARLPEDRQETVGCLILDEIAAERCRDERFAEFGDKLAALARRARAQHARGETTELTFTPDH